MNNLLNQVQLVGNLGKDVEGLDFEDGKKLAKVTMATNAFYYKDGERQQTTRWHNIVAWGKTAELMIKLGQKGTRMLVQGKLNTRDYETKEGQRRQQTEVVVDQFLVINTSQENPF